MTESHAVRVNAYQNLVSELATLDSLIAMTPVENVIDRMSLESRKEQVEAEIAASSDAQTHDVIQREVTLNGKFIGYLPESRQTEIHVSQISKDDTDFLGEIEDTVIDAKVDPSVQDAEAINASLDIEIEIVTKSKRVGQNKPTFVVVDTGIESSIHQTPTLRENILADDSQPFDEDPS